MAKKMPVRYSGAAYHMLIRGDRRVTMFANDEDQQRLLSALTVRRQRAADCNHQFIPAENVTISLTAPFTQPVQF